MPTERNPHLFDFARVEVRTVAASFDGGAISSDAGALLLGATDRALGLTRRLAACFKDHRDPPTRNTRSRPWQCSRSPASRWATRI